VALAPVAPDSLIDNVVDSLPVMDPVRFVVESVFTEVGTSSEPGLQGLGLDGGLDGGDDGKGQEDQGDLLSVHLIIKLCSLAAEKA
jgi:hypothetical protein